MACILPQIISPEQSGFVKGLNIIKNILLAQEIHHKIDTKIRGSNVMVKLNMAKAYNRMPCIFILKTLGQFSFDESMVWRLLSNNWYSLIINGQIEGYFKSSRGVKQGNHLSLCLFIIRDEVLSRGLINLLLDKQIIAFSKPTHCSVTFYLIFADDIVIFTNGAKQSFQHLMNFLSLHEKELGQLINKDQSSYIVGDSTSNSKCQIIKHVIGYSRKRLPIKYLGCVLFSGKKKIECF